MTEKLDYIAIDFETANHYMNSACSVGLVRFIDGQEVDSCYSLIHPAKMYFIPEWTETIHHITYKDVYNKPYFPEVWDTMVMPFINKTPGLPLVAHNGNMFDMPVIKKTSIDSLDWNSLNVIGIQNASPKTSSKDTLVLMFNYDKRLLALWNDPLKKNCTVSRVCCGRNP